MNQTRIAAPSDFAALLKAEIEALQNFLLILQSEHKALTEGNIDKLTEFSRLKSEQAVQLSQLSAGHPPALSDAGPSVRDITESIRKMDPDGKHDLMRFWEKLMDLAKQARYQNQLNGAMIEAQMKHNQQALAILQEAARQSSLYGPDGHAKAMGTGRQLGKI